MNQDNLPLVSIGVPTYNRPKGLKNLLSILTKQTYTNIEIIISDNNSENPEVQKTVQEFAQNDSRIKYIRQETNIGMYNNFSYVLKVATGEYFMWASDDDIFLEEFVSKTIQILESHPKVVLCTPVTKVLSGENEIMKFKPDFHTVNLNTMERIKKIAFYIKKGHGALYGLYRTEILKKVKLKTYIDTDGLLLLELSQFGEFYMLPDELMIAQQGINNKEQQSLTYQKKKLIETYNMKPKFFLLRFERFTLFIFFSLQSLKWKSIGFTNHLKVLAILYRSFYGYNTSKILSPIRNLVFYLKKRYTIVQINITPKEIPSKSMIEEYLSKADKIFLNFSFQDYDEKKIIDPTLYNSIHELINHYPEKLISLSRNYTSLHAQLQYGLDFIKKEYEECTHLVIAYDHKQGLSDLEMIQTKIKSWANYNRAIRITRNNCVSTLTIPIRKYISFKNDSSVSAGTINLTPSDKEDA